ncbi:gamma-glutamyltransferase family protein [bacterium]|nr:gamma-glutamyltransferase family protein [bacterium]
MMNHFTFDFPYPSQRMPLLARNIVATSQPLAAQAGLRMLRKCGNAVDAALAAAITLTVVEPNNNGLGSDAFALVWDGEKLHGLNASGRSPAALKPEHFDGMEAMPELGWGPTTVPGAVSAWIALSDRFGSVPFEILFKSALDYAENGFMVSPITALRWQEAKKRYRGFPEFADVFLPGGRAPKAGETVCFHDHAMSLKHIRDTRGEALYRGDLAEKIVAYAKATGGLMTMEDLAEHRADWVDPLSLDYGDITLHEIPPNGQGIAALIALGILRHRNPGKYPVDSADSLHLQIEAMKLAFADTHRYVSDPAFMELAPCDMLDPDYLSGRAETIDMKRAKNPLCGESFKGGTVYLAAADARGMMVSFIQSNYMGFGSGIVVPGTGIALQNRGSCFTLEKGHPNRVAGKKRPYHTIIPAFVTRNGQPLMSFGVMGGHMQPQGHVQMMLRIFEYGQNPQAASDAPRWQVFSGLDVGFEPGIKSGVLDELSARGHRIKILEPRYFGGAQLIYKLDNGYCAGSDHRKDGCAVGF